MDQTLEPCQLDIEAAEWIARLSGGPLTADQKQELNDWCNKSLAHKEALHSAAQLWADMDALTSLPDYLPAAAPSSSVRREKVRSFNFGAAYLSAAAVLIVLVIGWSSFFAQDTQNIQLYETAIGEQKTVTLSDQSIATLNTNSILEVDYQAGERRIKLIKGEVLFDVAKDPLKPFVVYAGGNYVRALGTKFAVRFLENGTENVEVLVTEGTVAVAKTDSSKSSTQNDPVKTILTHNQSVITREDSTEPSVTESDPGEMERRLSWATGILHFDGESLEEVVSEISRYTAYSVTIEAEDLRNIPIGGRFRIGETDALFEILQEGFGAEVVRHASGKISIYKSEQSGTL